MDLTASIEKQPTLEEVQALFEHWRRSCDKRRPIPRLVVGGGLFVASCASTTPS